MRIRFHTNLDEAKRDVDRISGGYDGCSHDGWFGGRVPCVGERVRLPLTPDNDREHYDLEVVGITYDVTAACARVELHIPSSWGERTLREWCDWLKERKRGAHG